MIKECAKRKLIITTFALLVFFITLSFPKTEDEIKNVTISYNSGNAWPIYLLDNSSLVARTSMVVQNKETIDLAKEIIEILTIDHAKSEYIPSIFTPVIPKDTEILSIDIQDKTLKINFNKNILNVPSESAEKMIECLTYSLTEIEGIEGIILYVEGDLLEKVPNTEIKLPSILTRDIGVNKAYDVKNLKETTKTTVYYIAKDGNISYYVPVTLLSNNEKDKVEIIIDRLKSKPNEQTNLMSYLNASTELTNYEILEKEVTLSFNDYLYEGLASDELKEEVKYSISLSVMDTLNVETVTFIES
ncbi:TPA: GerMN domain-containing protein [Candidatus Ventrenecus avicola]|nr:GerMN domain-containing protein [Candidatus Ventrenecus avicola]